jgi:hypothetical protein
MGHHDLYLTGDLVSYQYNRLSSSIMEEDKVFVQLSRQEPHHAFGERVNLS